MIIKVLSAGKWDSFKCLQNGKEVYLKPSSKLGATLEVGKEYDVTLYTPDGKKTTYITKLTGVQAPTVQTPVVQTAVVQTAVVEKPEVKVIEKAGDDKIIADQKQKYWDTIRSKESDGMARGNYRTIIGNFVINRFVVKEEFPSEEEIIMFNRCLKIGEATYFKDDVIIQKTDAVKEFENKEWEM